MTGIEQVTRHYQRYKEAKFVFLFVVFNCFLFPLENNRKCERMKSRLTHFSTFKKALI